MSGASSDARCPVCGMIDSEYWDSEDGGVTTFECSTCGTQYGIRNKIKNIAYSYGKTVIRDCSTSTLYVLYPFNSDTPNHKIHFTRNELVGLFEDKYNKKFTDSMDIFYQYVISDDYLIITENDFKNLCDLEAYKCSHHANIHWLLLRGSLCKVDDKYVIVSEESQRLSMQEKIQETKTEVNYSHSKFKVISELHISSKYRTIDTDLDICDAYVEEKQEILKRYYNPKYAKLTVVVLKNEKETENKNKMKLVKLPFVVKNTFECFFLTTPEGKQKKQELEDLYNTGLFGFNPPNFYSPKEAYLEYMQEVGEYDEDFLEDYDNYVKLTNADSV